MCGLFSCPITLMYVRERTLKAASLGQKQFADPIKIQNLQLSHKHQMSLKG